MELLAGLLFYFCWLAGYASVARSRRRFWGIKVVICWDGWNGVGDGGEGWSGRRAAVAVFCEHHDTIIDSFAWRKGDGSFMK